MAMLDFALKVAGPDSYTVDETDFAKLEAEGFSREDIWDIAAITGFYGLSNRMANVIGICPTPNSTPWGVDLSRCLRLSASDPITFS